MTEESTGIVTRTGHTVLEILVGAIVGAIQAISFVVDIVLFFVTLLGGLIYILGAAIMAYPFVSLLVLLLIGAIFG